MQATKHSLEAPASMLGSISSVDTGTARGGGGGGREEDKEDTRIKLTLSEIITI